MMRILLLLFTMCVYRAGYTQCQYTIETSTLGIGIVRYENFNHRDPVVEVFNDEKLTERFCAWRLYDEESETPFCAKFHKPDYSRVEIVALEILANSYKVIVNEHDVKYIPRDKNYIFYSWDDYLFKSYGVSRVSGDEKQKLQPIHSLASDDSPIVTIPFQSHELFCVLDVKGDWIRVKYDCYYTQEDNPYDGQPCWKYIGKCQKSATGWLRWRHANTVLITIYTLS